MTQIPHESLCFAFLDSTDWLLCPSLFPSQSLFSLFSLSVPDHVERGGGSPRSFCQSGLQLHHQQYLWREGGEFMHPTGLQSRARQRAHSAIRKTPLGTMMLISSYVVFVKDWGGMKSNLLVKMMKRFNSVITLHCSPHSYLSTAGHFISSILPH